MIEQLIQQQLGHLHLTILKLQAENAQLKQRLKSQEQTKQTDAGADRQETAKPNA